MRTKKDGQLAFEFQSSNLKVTRDHFARYAGIAEILDGHPEIVDAVHADLAKTVKNTGRGRAPGRQCEYTSETVLRVLICQIIEGEDLRGIVVRIDDSVALRRFVKIHDGPMMDSSALCRFKNAIRPATWSKVNCHRPPYKSHRSSPDRSHPQFGPAEPPQFACMEPPWFG